MKSDTFRAYFRRPARKTDFKEKRHGDRIRSISDFDAKQIRSLMEVIRLANSPQDVLNFVDVTNSL
jgi:hypothetical protein